ncbi:hypothetical protein VaNZ11_002636 [Volvox africanus]|uniref:Protein kinase domain-containing protein n=1 Tax=Volvox africanus TaxID=51714 RepID=A0ABQ5RSC9_9CHLO|nr:hypothetical protein VaNZ11_002636 [Volvox africanus]
MISGIITAFTVVFFSLPNLTAEHNCISRACRYGSNIHLSMASHKVPGRKLVVAAAVSAGPRRCANGLQFAAALADQSVEEVVLISDITLKKADWSNFSSPLKLMRNVTVRGFDENRDNWVVLDLSYVKNKIQLGAGVSLVFRFLVLNHWREDPHFMVPGLDLIAAGPIPESTDGMYWPAILARNAALIQRTCAPSYDPMSTYRSLERPAAFPGNQTLRVNVSQAGCLSLQTSNSNDDPGLLRPTRRCWPQAGVRDDFATFARNLEKTGRTTLAGYLVLCSDSDFFCETMMPEGCTLAYTPAGCYWRMFPRNVSGDIAAVPPTSAEHAQKTPNSSLKSAVLGIALGGTIGLCLMVLVGAVAIIMHSRGFHRCRRYHQQPLEGAPLYSLKYYYYYCCCGNLSDLAGGSTAATDSVTAYPDDPRDIDESCRSHGRLMTANRGQQHAELALHLTDRSSLLVSGLQRRHSDGAWVAVLPLRQASKQSGDFLTDPLCLMPVTSLTPLHPGINLDIKVDGDGEVTLSRVTLGKGGFGRVVKGMYRGIPVAVKLIDEGLATLPLQQTEVLPQAAMSYMSDAIKCVSHSAENKKAHCSDDIQVIMGGGGSIQQQQAVVIRAEASTPQQCGSAERAHSRTRRKDDCLTADLCTDNIKRAGAAGSMRRDGAAAGTAIVGVLVRGSCENDSRSICSKAIITSCEGVVTANSRKPATGDINRDMKSSAIPSDEENCTCNEPTTSSSHYTSYAGDFFEVYTAAVRSTLTEHHERIASIVAPADNEPMGPARKVLVEATLKQEVEVLARCQHPNIVRLLAASLQAPRFCLVMELMETSLDRLLYGRRETRRLLPLDMILHVGDQIARGLTYLHPTIVHRDLKPANVLISNAGSSRPVVKLADFGLSRLRNTVLITRNPEVGTAPYVAPEVFDAQNLVITDRVDVYAFGILLWEMLAGRRPWEGHNQVIVALLVAMHQRRPPLGLLSEERCPPKLRSLIHACWDPDPARRPAAAEIVKALALVQEALLHSSSSTAGASERPFLSLS